MRIAVLDDYVDVARSITDWDRISGVVELVVFNDHETDEDELVARLERFDVICIMRERTPFPASLLRRLPHLRLLMTSGTHNAAVDMQAARELGVTVCGTSGIMTDTPELAWALLSSLARDVPRQDLAVRQGAWQTGLGRGLAGKRLGLLGLGFIGTHMARYARAFEMEVVAWSPNLTAEAARERGAALVSKQALFATSDIVSIHLRLGERSRGIVGEAELRAMKPEALLVNTSRSQIIDAAALVRALREGWFGGAALDVFDEEPLPADHRLVELPNTILSPHQGYSTWEGFERYYCEMVDGIAAYQQGTPIRVLSAAPSV